VEIELVVYLDSDGKTFKNGRIINKDYSNVTGELNPDTLEVSLSMVDQEKTQLIIGKFKDNEYSGLEAKIFEKEDEERAKGLTLSLLRQNLAAAN